MGASPSKPGGGEHVQGTPVKIPPGEAVAESITTAFSSFANTWTVALAVLIADRPAAAEIKAAAAVLQFKNVQQIRQTWERLHQSPAAENTFKVLL